MENRKANYRKKDGQRLSAVEYRDKRKKEIRLHVTMLIAGTVIVVGGIGALILKFTYKPVEPANQEIFEEATADVSILEAIEEEKEKETEEDKSRYLTRSEDADSFFEGYEISSDDSTRYIASENVYSSYGVLINLDSGKVVASKDGEVRINPASMTKILTLLVAVEHIEDIDGTFTMTREIGDYVFSHGCSAVGFEVDEVITVKDLLYGTILPSGADAAMCLAEYVAGSQEGFVDMMNEKLLQLGLNDTAHFTNCVGTYDENHYCTLTDMAMILKAAEENELCHEVLSARTYLTSPTTQHPDGLQISNWFLRRIEDKDTHGEVMGAKTGFVNESGSCAASYQISNDGGHYICVTAHSTSAWRCIYDQVDIYSTFTM